MSNARLPSALALGLLWVLLCACPEQNVPEGPDAGAIDAAAPSPDGDGGCPGYTEDLTACAPAPTDYQPRQGVSGANGWPACISDDNAYHLVGSDTPSSASRSVSFDVMGVRLWNNSAEPTREDFLAARDEYSVAAGIASRVARRQDIHYAEVPGGDKFACQSAGVPEQYPERCAGPGRLKPIIDGAFEKGLARTEPRLQAARIEAALLWFFHLSLSSEVWTCSFNALGDCDSAMAYYSQMSERDAPQGLAKLVADLGPETHQRIFDAMLAVRCWRDADPALPMTNTGQYERAQAQLSKAALRGQALILRERIGRIGCLTGAAQAAQAEFVKVLGGLLDHDAGLLDAAKAAELKAYTASPTADPSAISAAQAAIDSIFACP